MHCPVKSYCFGLTDWLICIRILFVPSFWTADLVLDISVEATEWKLMVRQYTTKPTAVIKTLRVSD